MPPEDTFPKTRLAFPVTEQDFQALLTRLRQGVPHPQDLTLDETSPELVALRDWCEVSLGRIGSLSLAQVAEAIRVTASDPDDVELSRPGRPLSEKVILPEAASPREIPAQRIPHDPRPDWPWTAIGLTAGVLVGLVSRRAGGLILGGTLVHWLWRSQRR